MKRHAVLAMVAGALVAPVALAVGAANPTERLRLEPLAASTVRASAAVGRHGRGTQVSVDVSKTSAHARVRAVVNAGTCRKRSASFADAGSARSNANGRAHWTAPILFRSGPVDWDTVADGGHVLVLIVNGKAAACGSIPGMS